MIKEIEAYLATKVITAKEKDPATGVSEIEAEIDQLVYKLYDLTPEEIKIVEGKNERS